MKTRLWFPIMITSLFLMPIVSIALLGSWDKFRIKQFPVLSQVPDFRLDERSGAQLTLNDLSGKVWIGSFLFTSCSGQCPIIAQRVRKLQHELRHRTEVRFVSFSVDPDRDTVAALDEYARRFEANPLKWFFVTGEKGALKRVVREGFMMVMEPGSSETEAVMHSSKLALVDPWGRVRGFYDANEDSEMKQLLKDTRRLIKQAH